MKLRTRSTLRRRHSGVTLIELSVIILVLFAFISMTFIGAKAWKRGADRSACVLNIRHMQLAVRGFANSRRLDPGENAGLLSPPISVQSELIGPGKYLPGAPLCPGGGLYSFMDNTIPPIGTLYMTCSLAESNGHVPDEYSQW